MAVLGWDGVLRGSRHHWLYYLGSGRGFRFGLAVVFVGQTQAGLDLFPLFVFSPAVLVGFSVVLAS